MTSQHFGTGLECSASRGTGRFTVLMLIASLAAILLWLIVSRATSKRQQFRAIFSLEIASRAIGVERICAGDCRPS